MFSSLFHNNITMAKLRQALSLSSSTYKNHVFEGFSQLQQNDEFVDMTLAADGHWVKVHRMLVALSSPYFKELLRLMPCQHPIIYLTGVSNESLGYILEYIYTGEAEVPTGKMKSFLNTARELQIAGLKNITPPEETEISAQNNDTERIPLNSRPREQFEVNHGVNLEEPAIDEEQITIINENDDHLPSNIDVAMSTEEINVTNEIQNVEVSNMLNITLNKTANKDCNGQKPVAKIEILSDVPYNGNPGIIITGQCPLEKSYTEAFLNFNNQNVSINNGTNIPLATAANTNELSNYGDNIPMSEDIIDCDSQNSDDIVTRTAPVISLSDREQFPESVQQDSVLYTVSNRGALLLIMNRFMYYCHYQRQDGRKRRWRCIDYRDARCPAAVDTVGDRLVERKYKHRHPNHDEKIKKKIARPNVQCFPSIDLAEEFTRTIQRLSDKYDDTDALCLCSPEN